MWARSILQEMGYRQVAAKDFMWARFILQEMGYRQDNPTDLGKDNMSTIAIIKMTVTEKRRSILLLDST